MSSNNSSNPYSDIVWLDYWDEATGTLNDIDEDRSRLIFENFIVRLQSLEIPTYFLSLIGQRISVMKTDIPDSPILVLSDPIISHSQCTEQGQPTEKAGCVRDHDTDPAGEVPVKEE